MDNEIDAKLAEEGAEIAHFNAHELALMDELQGGRTLNTELGIPEYFVLAHMLENNPSLVDVLAESFAGLHAKYSIKAPHEHLQGDLKTMQDDGRFGDTELAIIPTNLALILDELIGGEQRNPEDNRREYFFGSLVGLATRSIPMLVNAGAAAGRAAIPALTSIARTGASAAAYGARAGANAIGAIGRAAAPVINKVTPFVTKYVAPAINMASKTGLTTALGQVGGQYIADKFFAPKPQELIVDNKYEGLPPELMQQQTDQNHEQNYFDNNNYYPEHYGRQGYSQGGDIAASVAGAIIPGMNYYVNAIDSVITGKPSQALIPQWEQRAINKKFERDQTTYDQMDKTIADKYARNKVWQDNAANQYQATMDKRNVMMERQQQQLDSAKARYNNYLQNANIGSLPNNNAARAIPSSLNNQANVAARSTNNAAYNTNNNAAYNNFNGNYGQ